MLLFLLFITLCVSTGTTEKEEKEEESMNLRRVIHGHFGLVRDSPPGVKLSFSDIGAASEVDEAIKPKCGCTYDDDDNEMVSMMAIADKFRTSVSPFESTRTVRSLPLDSPIVLTPSIRPTDEDFKSDSPVIHVYWKIFLTPYDSEPWDVVQRPLHIDEPTNITTTVSIKDGVVDLKPGEYLFVLYTTDRVTVDYSIHTLVLVAPPVEEEAA